jgi:phospholipid/cholesterol/gamma-HCH transport system substrate-binding protein
VRLTLRQAANVVLVTVVGLVASVWAVAGLAKIDPFDDPATVWVTAPEAGGALAGAEVTYLGVGIGRVTDADLVDDGVRLRLQIRPEGPMARDLRAAIRQKSALGEPYVDLAPAGHDAGAGDRVSVPAPLGELLADADALLAEVDPADLAAVVEGMSGVVGHEGDLRQLVASGAEVADALAARRTEMGSLLASSAALTDALDANRDALAAGLDGFARVGTTLAARTAELRRILEVGGELSTTGAALVGDVRADLEGVLAGLDATLGTLADRPGRLAEITRLTPLMITRFGLTFEGGNFWLSAGGGTVFFPGFQPRYGVPVYGTGLRLDRIVTPTIAQRVEVDLGGPPALVIPLLGPEDSAAAASSPAALLAIQEREAARLDGRTRP